MNASTSPIKPWERVVLTPKEFAAIFGRHRTWAYRQIRAGKVKVISKQGRMMIRYSEMERLVLDPESDIGRI
jgi:predicted site-specific integrase-resolvase